MCKYNQHLYWEALLPKNPWQSSFAAAGAGQALFVNTVMIDYRNSVLDNNWASYPDAKALLGFLQYLHLPLVFYHALRREGQELLVPVCSSEEFIAYIEASSDERVPVMRQAIQELGQYWQLDDEQCWAGIRDFCRRFNAHWLHKEYRLHIGVFADTLEIARYIMEYNEFPEVLAEDTGMTPTELLRLCDDFYNEPLVRKNFVSLLNSRIGCVI